MKKIVLMAAMAAFLTQGQANECAPNCGLWTFGADWLYWKPFQDNLEYVAKVTGSQSGLNFNIKSEPIAPNFNPDSGFRLFAAYEPSPQSWQIAAIYSRLSADANRSTTANFAAGEFMVLNSDTFPTFTILNSMGFQMSSIDSIWKLTFNQLDIDIRRPISCFSCFELTPHIGLRGLWMKQKLSLEGIGAQDGGAGDVSLLYTNLSQQFNGYGMEGGIYGSLPVGCGFSLIGHLGTSLLYAQISFDTDLVGVNTVTGGVTSLDVDTEISHLSPTIDGLIGLQYCGSCCNFPFEVHAGWEQHIIFASGRLGALNYANLTLQGLTLGASFSF